MVTSYCDDSGRSHTDRVAVVAGYIATVHSWEKKFAPAWRRALDKEGVEVMHRADLESFYGEFKESKGWNPTRRTAFVQKLQGIIKRHTYSGIGSAVVKADFEEVMPAWVKDLWGGPWGWCAHACVVLGRIWCEQTNHDEPIRWVFEIGTCGAREIGNMFNAVHTDPRYRLEREGYSFETKRVLPLQAADLVAYEMFKETENGVLDGHLIRPLRASAKALFRRPESELFQYWDKERLQDWLRGHRAFEEGRPYPRPNTRGKYRSIRRESPGVRP